MVELQSSKTDQRALYITLTQKCFDYFASKEDVGNMLLDMLFSGIPPAETGRMTALLGHMLQNT